MWIRICAKENIRSELTVWDTSSVGWSHHYCNLLFHPRSAYVCCSVSETFFESCCKQSSANLLMFLPVMSMTLRFVTVVDVLVSGDEPKHQDWFHLCHTIQCDLWLRVFYVRSVAHTQLLRQACRHSEDKDKLIGLTP